MALRDKKRHSKPARTSMGEKLEQAGSGPQTMQMRMIRGKKSPSAEGLVGKPVALSGSLQAGTSTAYRRTTR